MGRPVIAASRVAVTGWFGVIVWPPAASAVNSRRIEHRVLMYESLSFYPEAEDAAAVARAHRVPAAATTFVE
jgi:hypothetical protein